MYKTLRTTCLVLLLLLSTGVFASAAPVTYQNQTIRVQLTLPNGFAVVKDNQQAVEMVSATANSEASVMLGQYRLLEQPFNKEQIGRFLDRVAQGVTQKGYEVTSKKVYDNLPRGMTTAELFAVIPAEKEPTGTKVVTISRIIFFDKHMLMVMYAVHASRLDTYLPAFNKSFASFKTFSK